MKPKKSSSVRVELSKKLGMSPVAILLAAIKQVVPLRSYSWSLRFFNPLE